MVFRSDREIREEAVERAAERVPRVYLSPAEFAAAAGLRLEHVWALVRKDKLPHQKFGRWYRIPVTALGPEAAALLTQDGQADGGGR